MKKPEIDFDKNGGPKRACEALQSMAARWKLFLDVVAFVPDCVAIGQFSRANGFNPVRRISGGSHGKWRWPRVCPGYRLRLSGRSAGLHGRSTDDPRSLENA